MKKLSGKLALIVSAALVLSMLGGCKGNTAESESQSVSSEVSTEATSEEGVESSEETSEGEVTESSEEAGETTGDVTVLGEGSVTFYFNVTDANKETTYFQINTDKETVGEALVELGLVEGVEGDFGLYVKKVNGIVADYDVDGTYWAFYINGEYAMTGVDSTPVVAGDTYTFSVE